MATIRAYTTIEQSKHLVELGFDPSTADMYWYKFDKNKDTEWTVAIRYEPLYDGEIPCWSLASLLKIIGHYTLQTVSNDKKVFIVSEENYPICSDDYSEPVDACVAMIESLHKLNLL